MKIIAAFALLCILIDDSALGLDERSAMEKRCLKTQPKAFENFDRDWALSVKTWYFTHASRLEMYRSASDANRTPIDKINEDDLYYHSCLMIKWGDGGHPVLTGFHGKVSETTAKKVSPGVLKFNPGSYENGGIAVMTLTDNKTFQFFYKCYEDGEATWVVLSTTDDLDKKTENLIHEHARSLGFDEDNFTELEFEQCEGSNAQRDEL